MRSLVRQICGSQLYYYTPEPNRDLRDLGQRLHCYPFYNEALPALFTDCFLSSPEYINFCHEMFSIIPRDSYSSSRPSQTSIALKPPSSLSGMLGTPQRLSRHLRYNEDTVRNLHKILQR